MNPGWHFNNKGKYYDLCKIIIMKDELIFA